MNEMLSKKIVPYALVAAMAFSACGKKSECEIPTRHVHKYTKQVTDDITIEKYLDNEHLNSFGYHWNKDYIEITKDDEKLYKTIKGLFTGVDNWDYLYNEMSTHHDYLEFYYYYTTIETYTTTDSKGHTTVHTRTVSHSGWTKDPDYSHNTGKTRLYHHRYYGYRVIYKNGKFKLDRSTAVDDVRDVIEEYPYFSEDCVTEVYKEFDFDESELKYLSPEDFDVFTGPDLENRDLSTEKGKVKSYTKLIMG